MPIRGIVRATLITSGLLLLLLSLHMGRLATTPAPCMSVAVVFDPTHGYQLVWEGGQERLTNLPDKGDLTLTQWVPEQQRLILRDSVHVAYVVDVRTQHVTRVIDAPLDTTLLYNWGANPDRRVVEHPEAGNTRSYWVVSGDGQRTPLLLDINGTPSNLKGDDDYLSFSLMDGSLVWLEAPTGKLWQVYPSHSFPTQVMRSADSKWGLLVAAAGKDTRGNTLYSMERLNLRDGTLQTAPQALPLPVIGFSPTGAYSLLQRGNGIMPYSWAQQGILQAARSNPAMPDDLALVGWLDVNTVLLRLERAAPFRLARVTVLTGWAYIYPFSFSGVVWLPPTHSLLLYGDQRSLFYVDVDTETLTPLTRYTAGTGAVYPALCGDAYILTNPTRWGRTDRPNTRSFPFNTAMLGWIDMPPVGWGMPSGRLLVVGVLMLGVGLALGYVRRTEP